MKKTLLMAAFCVAAGMVTAQTDYAGVYAGELTINLGGPGTPEAKNIDIYNGSEEGTVTFVLPNFVFAGSFDLGDIVLTDIPVTDDGKMTLTDYPLQMAALGNTTVTVNMNATLAETLVANLTINVPGIDPVPVTFTGTRTLATEGYQVRNGGFEGEWEEFKGEGFLNKWTGYEPQHWNSFTSATGEFASMVQNGDQLKENDDVRPGSMGSKSALVMSKYQFIAAANGNLTTGRINAGSYSAADAANHNFSDPTVADNDDYLCPFVGAPDSLAVWMKYVPVAGEKSTMAKVSAIIHNDQRYQDPEDKDYTDVKVAEATDSIAPTNAWKRISVPFSYEGFLSKENAKNILVSFSTNTQAGGGNISSKTPVDSLWVDDLEMVYNTQLTSLNLGDESVSLEEGVFNYNLSQTLGDTDPVVEANVNSVGATVITGFNRANQTASVIVRGGDFAANPTNALTYTLHFANEGPGTGFDTPAAPKATLLVNGNMLYIVSSEASLHVEVYGIDGRLVTLTSESVIALPNHGVYVVRVNGETHKVVAQ